MSIHDELMREFTMALAAAPKRMPRARANRELSAEAQAVVIAAADAKLATVKAEHDAREAREEADYYRRTGRLRSLGERATAAKKALAACEGDAERTARLERYMAAIDAARESLFGLPVVWAELQEGGRFWRRAKWLGLNVGMLAVDESDIVCGAIELCYVKGQTAENARGDQMPTLGAMYRNLKLYYHAQLDRFRRNKSAGVIAVHSIEDLTERLGDAWLDREAHRVEALGYGYATPEEVAEMGIMRPVQDVAAHVDALELADMERQLEKLRAEREAKWRDELAKGAQAPAGHDARMFHADRVAIRMLINGSTIADVANVCNVSPATITGRLLQLEGALGATRYSSGLDHEPIVGNPLPKRAPRLHETKAMTSSREGTRATPVVVSQRA